MSVTGQEQKTQIMHVSIFWATIYYKKYSMSYTLMFQYQKNGMFQWNIYPLIKHRYTPWNWHLEIVLYCFLSIWIQTIWIQRNTEHSILCCVCAAGRARGFLACHTLEYLFQFIRLWDMQTPLTCSSLKSLWQWLLGILKYIYFLDTSFVILGK